MPEKWENPAPSKNYLDKCKSMQRRNIKYEGVKLFNCLPECIRKFQGKMEDFKKILDEFLTEIPDQPETEDLSPGGRTELRKPSNSIVDWLRVEPSLKCFSSVLSRPVY